MKYLKKVLAAVVCAAMLLSMSACADTTWAFNYDGTIIPAGLYLEMTMEGYNAISSQEGYDSEKGVMEQTIEGKSSADWIKEKAREMADQYIAVGRMFDEVGLTISDEDQATIDNSVDNNWESYSAVYEKNGVGKENYKRAVTSAWKKQALFDYYYAEGGVEEVTEETIKTYYSDNYLNLNIFSVTLASGDDLTEEQLEDNEARKASVDEYIAAINDKTKSFNEVRDSFNHTYLSGLYGETHDSSVSYDQIQEDTATVSYLRKDSTQYTETLMKALLAMEIGGDAKAVEDNGTYYIVKRYDTDDTFEGMKDTILSDMKGEEFEAKIAEWTSGLNPTVNTAAINHYNPANIDLSSES